MTVRFSALLLPLGLTFMAILLLALRIDPGTQNDMASYATEGEKLLVFSQSQDQHFQKNSLPQLKAWAKQEKIELIEMDIRQGIPAEITATPSLIFVNQQGKAVYASRYAEIGTIKNFVRTSRLRPQNRIPLCKEKVLMWKQGRAQLQAVIKQTPLQGAAHEQWSDPVFQEKIKAAFLRGMSVFKDYDRVCLLRTDRSFYCDIHPYLADDGQIYLSLELFSMFNCIRSVYKTGDTPLQGDINDCTSLFAQAGQMFQEQIMLTINESDIGDAWTPIPSGILIKSWEDMGFDFSESSQITTTIPLDFELQQEWAQPQPAIPGVPSLFFRFMEPLDRYAGEVPDFSGQLSLYPNGSLKAGNFTANLQSLTMGMTELDDKVKRKYIYTKRFPEANFEFMLPEEGSALQPGQINRIPVNGTFRFMKQERPLRLQAELTPRLNEAGQQELAVHIQFDVNITDDYGIEGPDGPEEASKTMIFDLNFFLTP